MYEVAWLPACDVCDHIGEQHEAGHVEGPLRARDSQAHVSCPPVQLAGQLTSHHGDLAKGMAERWGQKTKCFWIPAIQDDSSVLGFGFNCAKHLLWLVYSLT